MQLTKKSSYGLIALLEIASGSSEQPISATDISTKYSLPAPFVVKILYQLKCSGIITAKPGRSGGYYLVQDPETISVRQLIEILDKPLALLSCLTTSKTCQLDAICPTKALWEAINGKIKEALNEWTLQDLLDQQVGTTGDGVSTS
ncbi:Rrf2 family transcriptional regulator [Candidatus Acetothermia bacterium]|nr:Rrf2 family transcriptional regulator [Candidatus Acetothermia bacterium]MCI2426303.1 Rrf2 family transcriptional regulator [Candidatus Acetothermia bacterium]MCI2427118.1 Rrf2 family transcriptional regulator [Candidatus Acetothermia bacterium]MCI2428462.1 Rrf2 family transcriptional regulator [Candidatus Acetothermia bacterium]